MYKLILMFLMIAGTLLIAACDSIPFLQSTPTSTASPTPTPSLGGPVSDALRVDTEAYAKQFGVPVEEAIQRLQYQEGIGELNFALQAEEGGTFGGLWIEHEPKFKVVVLFTRDGKKTIQPYLAGKPFADLVEVRRARYSLAELETIYAQTNNELAKLDFYVNTSLDVQGFRKGLS
jgi:hypothetical protein